MGMARKVQQNASAQVLSLVTRSVVLNGQPDQAVEHNALITTPHALQEAIAIALRCSLLLSVEDLLPILCRFSTEPLSEDTFRHSLKAHKVSRFVDFVPYEIRPYIAGQQHKEPGAFLMQVLKLIPPGSQSKPRYLYIALDLGSRWCFMQAHASRSPRTARHFLRALVAQAPMRVVKVFARSEQSGRLSHEDGQSFQKALHLACRNKGVDYQPVSFLTTVEEELAWGKGIDLRAMFQGLGGKDVQDAQVTIDCFIKAYNSQTPLRALGGLTPSEVLDSPSSSNTEHSGSSRANSRQIKQHWTGPHKRPQAANVVEHFGLREMPFAPSTQMPVLFVYPGYQEALNTLLLTARRNDGLVKITGEAGTGKSLLCQYFLGSLDENFHTVHIDNPCLEARAFLQMVAQKLGLFHDVQLDQYRLLSLLKEFVERSHNNGKRLVLCIDNAQAMPLETLEILQLLTDLKTESKELPQVILFGRQALDGLLDHPAAWKLKQQINYSQHLAPLSRQQARQYIAHCMKAVGQKEMTLFSRRALRLLCRESGGVPQAINVLAGQALQYSADKGAHIVKGKAVRLAVKTLESEQRRVLLAQGVAANDIITELRPATGLVFRQPVRSSSGIAAVVLVALALVGGYAYYYSQSQTSFFGTPVVMLDEHVAMTSDLQSEPAVVQPLMDNPTATMSQADHSDADKMATHSGQTEKADAASLAESTENRKQHSLKTNMVAPLWVSQQLRATENWRPFSWKLAAAPSNGAQEQEANPLGWKFVIAKSSGELQQIRAAARGRRPIAVPTVEDAPQVATELQNNPLSPVQNKATRSEPRADLTPNTDATAALQQSGRVEKTPVTQTPADKAAQAYAKALDLYNRGMLAQAEPNLWLALDHDAGHIEARTLSVYLMIEQGRLSKAQQLLLEGIEIAPRHYPFVQTLAHILANQGHEQEALERMVQARPMAQDDADYLSLLAWLYQRNSAHAEAAEVYTETLSLRPDEGKLWLGLAISLEAQAELQGARDAYNYAMVAGLDAGLRQYALRRMQQIGRH